MGNIQKIQSADTVETASTVKNNAITKADKRLKTIANTAEENVSNAYDDVEGSIWGLWMNGMLARRALRQELRDRIANTREQIKNHNTDNNNQHKVESWSENILWKIFGEKQKKGLYNYEIRDYAEETFGSQAAIADIYTIMPTGKNSNISIYEAKIDSAVYNAIPYDEETKEYFGVQIDRYEINNLYSNFIRKLLPKDVDSNPHAQISPEEEKKFMQIIKALNTQTAFSKEQLAEEDPHKSHKMHLEDVDIFDLSGDGELNYGDIAAMKLKRAMAENEKLKQFVEEISVSKNTEWSLKEIQNKTGLNHKEVLALFNLDGSKEIDNNDLKVLKNLVNNPEISKRHDINGDGQINADDEILEEEYLKAALSIYSSAKGNKKAIENIFGGEKKIDSTTEKLK